MVNSVFRGVFNPSSLNILEIGFGTGLNALITLIESEKLNLKVNYKGIEAYPVNKSEVVQLDYANGSCIVNVVPSLICELLT